MSGSPLFVRLGGEVFPRVDVFIISLAPGAVPTTDEDAAAAVSAAVSYPKSGSVMYAKKKDLSHSPCASLLCPKVKREYVHHIKAVRTTSY